MALDYYKSERMQYITEPYEEHKQPSAICSLSNSVSNYFMNSPTLSPSFESLFTRYNVVEHTEIQPEQPQMHSFHPGIVHNPPAPRSRASKHKLDRPDDNRPKIKSTSITSIQQISFQPMESFVPEKVTDFKHVIYNLLVDNHNNSEKFFFVQPCSINEKGTIKYGFCFNEKDNPDKKLPELYALHIRKARLDQEDSNSVFIQDLYKYYLRAAIELLSKYFEKRDKYTYIYEDIPLFVANGSLEDAEQRMKAMKTRSRKKKMRMNN